MRTWTDEQHRAAWGSLCSALNALECQAAVPPKNGDRARELADLLTGALGDLLRDSIGRGPLAAEDAAAIVADLGGWGEP